MTFTLYCTYSSTYITELLLYTENVQRIRQIKSLLLWTLCYRITSANIWALGCAQHHVNLSISYTSSHLILTATLGRRYYSPFTEEKTGSEVGNLPEITEQRDRAKCQNSSLSKVQSPGFYVFHHLPQPLPLVNYCLKTVHLERKFGQ